MVDQIDKLFTTTKSYLHVNKTTDSKMWVDQLKQPRKLSQKEGLTLWL